MACRRRWLAVMSLMNETRMNSIVKLRKNKIILLVSALLAGPASAELFTQYSFEETTGTVAVDSVGSTQAAFDGAGLGTGLSQDTVNFREGSSSLYFDGVSMSRLHLTNVSDPARGLLGDGAPVGNTAHWDATIMYWMKADINSQQDGVARVLESRWGGGTRLIMRADSNAFDGTGMRIDNAQGHVGYIETDPFDGNWHHVAMVIDQADDGDGSGGIQIYLDGALEVNLAPGPAHFALGPETFLGSWHTLDNREGSFYTGNLDDFRIYRDEKLTAQEIIQAAEVDTTLADLKIRYEFEEPTGTVPVDTRGFSVAAFDGSGLGTGLSRDAVNFKQGSSSLYFDGVSMSRLHLTNVSDPTRGLLGDGAPVGNTAHWDATIMYWMKADTVDPGSSSQRVIESMWGGNLRLGMRADTGDGDGDGMRVQLDSGYVGSPGNTPSSGVFDGEWHHVAMVIDQADDGDGSGGIQVYLDGALEVNLPAGAPHFALGPDTFLGSWHTPDGREGDFYKGNLDDFRIYRSRKMSQAEIQLIFNDISLPPNLEITEFDYNSGTDTVTLTWRSNPGVGYAVWYSGDLLTWPGDIGDNILGEAGETTTYSAILGDFGLVNESELFFRVEEE